MEQLHKDLAAEHLTCARAVFDVADSVAVERYFARHFSDHGRLDLLVNNAYSGPVGTIQSSTAEQFDDALRVGVTSAFVAVQAALPALRAAAGLAGSSAIVNVASMYGTVSPDPSVYGESGQNNPPFYGAAKGGLLQLTRYLAVHLGPERIRVNAVSPGPVLRPEAVPKGSPFVSRLTAKVPLGRLGKPADVASAVMFLGSDASTFVTGVNLPVDGGWTAW